MTRRSFPPCVSAVFLVLACGTHAQTVELVLDLNPGARGSGPSYLTPYRGDIYFRANSGLQNVELWRYDGTNGGQVAEIHPNGSSTPTDLTVADDTLYFAADDGTGQRLWSWNGTGAVKIAAANGIGNPQEMIAFNGALYFRGAKFGTVGIELFKFDGASLTTIDIYPGTGSSFPQHFVEYNGALYFNANGTPGQGTELWRYNGTTLSKAGQNIYPGNGSSPEWLCVFRGQLYFSAYDGVHGRELWRFDGIGSSMVADVVPGGQFASFNPSGMTVFKDAIYFNANDGSGGGFELWKYDGAGFTMVANINPNPPGPGGDDFLADSNPSNFTVHDHRLFFTADDGSHGSELWVYDGDAAPHIVGDIYPGQYGSNQGGLRSVNGVLYLAADSGDGYGQELYRVVPAPVVDEDGDGLPDDWEVAHGLNPALNEASADKDGDSISNAGEFAAGTLPEIPTSVYQAELDRDRRLSWPSVPGRTYRVEINGGSGWTLFRTVSAAPAPTDRTLLSVDAPEGAEFALFRVVVTAE